MNTLLIRKPGLVKYPDSYRAMSEFTSSRNNDSIDEIWCLQHPPVYTLGLAGKREHLLDTGVVPVIATDRGGQVSYHGPGQLVYYPLLDLRRRKTGIKDYVHSLEQAVIDYLDDLAITAERRPGAPGVYVDGRKIAALGIRVRRGCTYHGLSFNVAMDLAPFRGINPCGYPGLEVTQLAKLCPGIDIDRVCDDLLAALLDKLGDNKTRIIERQDLDHQSRVDAA